MNCRFEFLFHSHLKADTSVNMHKHNCYELVYYIKGSGITSINDVNYKYSKNSFSIIPPGCLHDEFRYDDTEVIFIGFSCSNSPISLDNGIYHEISSDRVQLLLENMMHELAAKNNHYTMKLDLLVQETLIEFDRLRNKSTKAVDDLSAIIVFLKENFHQNITIESLARLSGYSYHHFRHLFKQKTGLSPINYLIDIRIENAKKLLAETDLKISSISENCGFASTSQFCTLFNKFTRKTPIQFRKSHAAK